MYMTYKASVCLFTFIHVLWNWVPKTLPVFSSEAWESQGILSTVILGFGKNAYSYKHISPRKAEKLLQSQLFLPLSFVDAESPLSFQMEHV